MYLTVIVFIILKNKIIMAVISLQDEWSPTIFQLGGVWESKGRGNTATKFVLSLICFLS